MRDKLAHECLQCMSLGRSGDAELYLCRAAAEPCLIARKGTSPNDYEALSLRDAVVSGDLSGRLLEALTRAARRGYVPSWMVRAAGRRSN